MDLGSVGAIAALFTAIVEPGGGYQRHATVYGLVTAMNVVVVGRYRWRTPPSPQRS